MQGGTIDLSLVFGVATQLIREMACGDQLQTFAERNESDLIGVTCVVDETGRDQRQMMRADRRQRSLLANLVV